MTVEIDEVKLQEMQEDMDNYVKLIKRYDESFLIKKELIKRLESELDKSKDIIVILLDLLSKSNPDNEEMQQKISEIISDVEKTRDED